MRVIRFLPVVFLVVGGMAYLERSFNSELTRLAQIRWDFAKSVNDTKLRLISMTWNALSDVQIQQNIEAGQSANIGQYLQNYLRVGEVSQFDMLDDGCNLMTRVPQNNKPVTDLCNIVKSSGAKIVWQQSEHREPILVFVARREIAGKNAYLAAQVVFDQAWLSLNPILQKLSMNREISYAADADGAVLWNEGYLGATNGNGGSYALPLRIDGILYRLIPDVSRFSLAPIRENFWLLYSALGCLIVAAIWQESARSRKDDQERSLMIQWVREHNQKKNMNQNLFDESQPPSWTDIVNQAKLMIADKDEQRSFQTRLAKERLEILSARLRERDAEIAQLADKIAGMSDLSSLQEQLQHTTTSFLKQMEQMREVCENLFDVMTSGISHQAKSLRIFCGRWKDGINAGSNREIAARKFFRNLVETKGSVPGFTKLDDEIREFEQLTSVTLDQSTHAALLARQAVDNCEAAIKLATLWHNISARDSGIKTADWALCLISAQKLVVADERYHTLTFEALPRLGNPEDFYPPVSGSALISGFFHLYLALLQEIDIQDISMPLVVRQKRFKEQASIILSLPAKRNGAYSESPDRKMTHHIELAKQILAGCGIKVALLPQTVAGCPVGLTWNIPQKQVTMDAVPEIRETLTALVEIPT